MAVLRNLRETTRLLFLHEVTANRHTRLRTIAERLEMTVQGAADYAHELESNGLLAVAEGEYRPTKKGIQFLQSRLRELRAFVDQASRTMAFVETTAALAGAVVHKGDRLGLFMEGGYLVAYPGRESPSRGIATADASRGEEVAVRDLQGIIGLRPGRITVARVPAVRDGGSNAIHPAKAQSILARTKGSVVAAAELGGIVAARKLGLRARIEFAAVPGAIRAAERGAGVLLLVPEESAAEAVQSIEAENARLEDKIPYESVALR